MSALLVPLLLLGVALGLAACDVTGVAPPESTYAHSGGLQYLGEPGSTAP